MASSSSKEPELELEPEPEPEPEAAVAASADATSTHCLVCHSRLGVSSRNSIEIFKHLLSDDRPVSESVGGLLTDVLKDGSLHSQVICKKCFKLVAELDEIDARRVEIKEEIVASYKRTLELLEEEKVSETANEEDRKLPLSSDDGNVTKYKLLLPKGRKKMPPKKVKVKADSEEESEHKENASCDIEMSDHDSDSDYVLDNPQELTLERDGEQIIVQIKMEPEDDEMEEVRPRRNKRKAFPREEEAELPDRLVKKEDADFSCCICPEAPDEEKIIMDMKTIIAHLKSTHNIRVYICDICGQVFKKRNELSIHLDEHVATEEGDFQCEVCNRIFSNLRLFRVHKRMHYPQTKTWTCESCGKRYSSQNLLHEHMNTHTGTRPYMCTTCGKDFASKYTYKAHTKTHEVRPRPFSCGECGKTFLSIQNLQQHERTHNGMRNYVCDQCGKAFGTARNLEVHSVVHSGYKPFICRMCGKAFARKAEIRDHERTHTGEKPYQCEFCGATFSQRSNLQSHKRATHYQDKRYKCNDCNKGFKRRRLLDYHIKAAHTGERPYKCVTCEATFVYPEHFKKHRRIHTGEKPFHCEVCGKAFNSRDNRNAHRFVHSDKKPYECLVCGMGFMRKPLLYNHMQTQGHLNDTIVVNQPRLTTDDDLIVESSVAELHADPSDVEMAIVEGIGHSDQDAKLYISELKEHVIIQEEDEEDEEEEEEEEDEEGNYIGKTVVVGNDRDEDDENMVHEDVEHLIIDGQVHFADPEEIVNMHGDISSVAEITATTSDYKGGEGRGRMIVVPATPRVMQSSGECYEGQATGDQEEVTLTDLTPSPEVVQMTETGSVRMIEIQVPASENPNGNRWYIQQQ